MQFYSMCEEDSSIFEAANLRFLLPSGSISAEISSRLNLDELRQTIRNTISNATGDFNFNQTSFLPDNLQESLEEFRNSSVDQINITGTHAHVPTC